MISRRQIIESQQELERANFQRPARVVGEFVEAERDDFNRKAKSFVSRKAFKQELGPMADKSHEYEFDFEIPRRQAKKLEEDEDEDGESMMMKQNQGANGGRQQVATNRHHRHFDPYSVYGEEDEEEDVWYSEERLFEVSSDSHFLLRSFRSLFWVG